MAAVRNIDVEASVRESGYDFGHFMNILETNVVVQANATAWRMAQTYRKRLIRNIKQQKFPLVPLSKEYARFKERTGLDPRTLIATGKLISHIKVWKWRRGNVETYIIGIPPRATYKRVKKGGHRSDVSGASQTRTPVMDVARWLEYGTSKMPPRPVWFMTFAELIDDHKTWTRWYERQFRKTVKAKLKRAKRKLA